jgi:hypothetical protein
MLETSTGTFSLGTSVLPGIIPPVPHINSINFHQSYIILATDSINKYGTLQTTTTSTTKEEQETRTTMLHLSPYVNSPFLIAIVVKPNNRKNLIFPGGASSCAGGPFVIQIVTKVSDPAPPSSPSESEPTLLLLLLLLQV